MKTNQIQVKLHKVTAFFIPLHSLYIVLLSIITKTFAEIYNYLFSLLAEDVTSNIIARS